MISLIKLLVVFFSSLLVLSSLLEIAYFPYRSYDIFYGFYVALYIYLIYLNRDVFSIYFFRSLKSDWYKERFPKSLYLLMFTGLLIGSCFAYQEFNDRDIWLDEYTQFYNTLSNGDSFAVQSAARQQQTPMDYQLSYLSGTLMGIHVLPVRFFAIVFFILTLILVPLLLYNLFGSLLSSFLGLGIYLSNPYLLYYSIEGRPIQLALFWCLLYVFLNYRLILFKELKENRTFFAVTVLFVLTTGLQPIMMIFSIGITVLFWLFCFHRTVFGKYFRIHLGVVLSVLPAVILIYKESVVQNQFHKSFMEGFIKYLMNVQWRDFLFFLSGFEGLISLSVFCISTYLIIFFRQRSKLRRILIPFISFSIFVVISDVFFKSYINWSFYYRYIIVVAILFIFIFVGAFSDLIKYMEFKNKIKSILVMSILGGAIYFNFSYDFQRLNLLREYLTLDASVYDYLKKSSVENDCIMRLNLEQLGGWRTNFWISGEIYMPHERYPQLQRAGEEVGFGRFLEFSLPPDKWNSSKEFKLFLVVYNEHVGLMNYWEKAGLNVKMINFKGENIYVFDIPMNEGKDLFKKILYSLLDYMNPAVLGSVYEQIFYHAYVDKNINEMKKMYQKIKELKKLLDPSHQDYEIGLQEWKMRVSLYKEKIQYLEESEN